MTSGVVSLYLAAGCLYLHTPHVNLLACGKRGWGKRSGVLLGDLAHPFEVESPRLHRLEMVSDELLAAGGVGKAAVQELLQLRQ